MVDSPIELNFEMAYDFSSGKYVIYKANHNGYWVPDFSSGYMTKEFQTIFKKTLLKAFGIPEWLQNKNLNNLLKSTIS